MILFNQMDWKKLFKKNLIETKKNAGFFTIMDKQRHNKLLELTEDDRKFDINDYYKAWTYQTDEKYINTSLKDDSVTNPSEILIFNYEIEEKCYTFLIKRDYIISPCITEYNIYESQIYSFLIIEQKYGSVLFDSGLISPLENNNLIVDYPRYYYFKSGENSIELELFPERKLIINGVYVNIKPSSLPKLVNTEISCHYELLKPIYHIQLCANSTTFEHIIFKYDDNAISKIARVLFLKYNNGKMDFINTMIKRYHDENVVKINRNSDKIENFKCISKTISWTNIQYIITQDTSTIVINPSIVEKFFGIRIDTSTIYPTNILNTILLIILLMINFFILFILSLVYPFL
tara:strand:+ start:201 stop:1244 length:1044 start_codon:yes stop_codon:yes gene_type:complete